MRFDHELIGMLGASGDGCYPGEVRVAGPDGTVAYRPEEAGPYPVGSRLAHRENKRVRRRVVAYAEGCAWLAVDGSNDKALPWPIDALERCFEVIEG